MANTFIRKTERNIGTSLTQIDSYEVTGTGKIATVIGLSVSNTTSSAVDIDAALNDGSNDFYIVKNCPLPSGSTVVLVGGDQKVVMEENDLIKVKSSASSSIDVVMSILEIT
jgi:hypothetical protein